MGVNGFSELAGALSALFAGGSGPSHSSIGTAFALAGYSEPQDDTTLNKQQRVLKAVRSADEDCALRLAAEIVGLYSPSYWTDESAGADVKRFVTALGRVGGLIAEGGYVTWNAGPEAAPRPTRTPERVVIPSAGPSVQAPSSNKKVMVVYGRDGSARAAIFGFLRALGLEPIEWEQAVQATGSASPYTKQAVEAAFSIAQAVVVLLTPDDEVSLHPGLSAEGDPERTRTMQARPNVFIELGMSVALHPNRTLIVEVGSMRQATDMAGVNVVRLRPDPQDLHAVATRLETAGCPVNRSAKDWLDASPFQQLEALSRGPSQPAADMGSTLGVQDTALFGLFLNDFPSARSIKFLAKLNFGGSFEQSRLDDIDNFLEHWSDAEHQFLDADMEAASVELYNHCAEFRNRLSHHTYPHGVMDGYYEVPSEWELQDPDRFDAAVAELAALADVLVESHQALVLQGRRRAAAS